MAGHGVNREELADSAIGKVISHLVATLADLDDFEPHLVRLLAEQNLHAKQIKHVVARNRELMGEGVPHARALLTACDEVGEPALKKELVWDDALREIFQRCAG